MAIEVDYGKYLGDDVVEERSDILLPGSHRVYKDLRPSNDVVAFLSNDNTRGVLKIKGLPGLYAIKYYGEDDEEGEIADLSEGFIELSQGDEVKIVKDGKRAYREMWFYLDQSSGNVERLTAPTDALSR
jgi:hypothetical protein